MRYDGVSGFYLKPEALLAPNLQADSAGRSV
jgi:hypothetical protein